MNTTLPSICLRAAATLQRHSDYPVRTIWCPKSSDRRLRPLSCDTEAVTFEVHPRRNEQLPVWWSVSAAWPFSLESRTDNYVKLISTLNTFLSLTAILSRRHVVGSVATSREKNPWTKIAIAEIAVSSASLWSQWIKHRSDRSRYSRQSSVCCLVLKVSLS